MSQPQFTQETALSLPHATVVIGAHEHDQTRFLQQLGVSSHDTITIDASVDGGIKVVRSFGNQLQLAPQFGSIRLGIILGAENLTPEAQNALLKILEEPPNLVKIILFARQEAALLPTVLSRCRRYYNETTKQPTAAALFLSTNPLEQFLQAEQLAEATLQTQVENYLSACYQAWCALGRPGNGLDELERIWYVYEKLESNVNKRLVLEQFVLSSL